MINKYIPGYELSEKLISRLHDVKRWHGTAQHRDGGSESDLEHTAHMEKLLIDIQEQCPGLATEIDDMKTAVMIALHDTGEVLVGDPPQELTREQRAKHDIRERRLGLWLYNKSPEMKELYRRSFDVESDDKEALFCKFLDKMQAGEYLMGTISKSEDPKVVIENAEEYTLKHAYNVYKKLAELLPDGARNELKEVLKDYQGRAENLIAEMKNKIVSKI